MDILQYLSRQLKKEARKLHSEFIIGKVFSDHSDTILNEIDCMRDLLILLEESPNEARKSVVLLVSDAKNKLESYENNLSCVLTTIFLLAILNSGIFGHYTAFKYPWVNVALFVLPLLFGIMYWAAKVIEYNSGRVLTRYPYHMKKLLDSIQNRTIGNDEHTIESIKVNLLKAQKYLNH